MLQNSTTHPKRGGWISIGDKGTNALEIRDSSIRLNYLDGHALAYDSNICSTANYGLDLPAAKSLRPTLTELMMRNACAISSREAFTGSRYPQTLAVASISFGPTAYSSPIFLPNLWRD